MKRNLIIFDKENLNNEYFTFKEKLKPRIDYDDNFTIDECEKLPKIKESMMKEMEDFLFEDYLADLEGEDFPNLRIMTGNYYVQCVSYNKTNKGGYQIIVAIRMTSLEEGKEEDYFGIDFSLEFDTLDEKPEIEVLGTSVL